MFGRLCLAVTISGHYDQLSDLLVWLGGLTGPAGGAFHPNGQKQPQQQFQRVVQSTSSCLHRSATLNPPVLFHSVDSVVSLKSYSISAVPTQVLFSHPATVKRLKHGEQGDLAPSNTEPRRRTFYLI
jgi:hypothetical protein